jgi:acetolactate synthase I/II/III large subunit
MGYALPASIGAYFNNDKEIICITGDGSIQMNIQELQTIRHHNIPIKIFVLNNEGYRSIEQTQSSFFNGNFIGCNKKSGVSFPNISKVAKSYDMPSVIINNSKNLRQQIINVLNINGPVICEVVIGNKYVFEPKLSSKKMSDGTIVASSLENLAPVLSDNELSSNMIGENEW